MSPQLILPLNDAQATLESVGGKGASLARLINAGFPVPDGFHITTEAYRRFVQENELQQNIDAALQLVDVEKPSTLEEAAKVIREAFLGATIPGDIASVIVGAYGDLAGTDPAVAVRSSATAEDLPEASFAGQQETYLNVSGADHVLEATKKCWSSLWTARAIGYRHRQGISSAGVALAVVIQRLVDAEVAGILFTVNPVDGNREHALISAAWGLGDAVVGGRVTPDEYVMEKRSGRMVRREVADKELMTVVVDEETEDQPVPENLRNVPVLQEADLVELNRFGVEIEGLYGMPMDIEWALADGKLAIVQARPITALPEPTFEPPTDWPMPDPKGPYMRGSIADFMPDPLTPLFLTMAIPAINAAMGRTMKEMIGGDASILESFITTINDYAYQYVKLGCRDWLWVVFRMLPAIPRLLRDSERHWREVARPQYMEVVTRWRARSPQELSAVELITGVDELTNAMADHLTALQVDTLGAAAGSEGLFTTVYDKLVKREGDPIAATLLLGADSTPIQGEKSLYDLALWSRQHNALADYLLNTPTSELAARLLDDEGHPEIDAWEEWRRRFQEHLQQYGHSIYDLDFAKPLPVEEPLPLLELLKLFIQGEGVNPHERQQILAARREAEVEAALSRVKGLKLRLFRWTLRLAQSFSVMREDSIFDIGLGYPVLRQILHRLGVRLVNAGAIADADDIYWLEKSEVENAAVALDRDDSLENLMGWIEVRKAEWRAKQLVQPPMQLPPKERIMGIKMDAFMPVSADEQTEETLKGIAASSGRVTATARVLHSSEEFGQMKAGDILVAEITTPAWTPLFAMAAGIVTDIGGPLSHGSIVAREYGIPAVLGTGIATRVIQSGQQITVDGDAGLVTLN
ncbi:MAG: hypothetical protein JSV37_12835 [Anaerolineaceae bacterium]|nr:MAG: hypothetical protein JSV37_12835 [Anaerolineaceae bacterium]